MDAWILKILNTVRNSLISFRQKQPLSQKNIKEDISDESFHTNSNVSSSM